MSGSRCRKSILHNSSIVSNRPYTFLLKNPRTLTYPQISVVYFHIYIIHIFRTWKSRPSPTGKGRYTRFDLASPFRFDRYCSLPGSAKSAVGGCLQTYFHLSKPFFEGHPTKNTCEVNSDKGHCNGRQKCDSKGNGGANDEFSTL